MRNEDGDIACKVCKHRFFAMHYNTGRTEPYDDERRRRRCRDCRKCNSDDNKDFEGIVQGIKNPNHTAPEREHELV